MLLGIVGVSLVLLSKERKEVSPFLHESSVELKVSRKDHQEKISDIRQLVLSRGEGLNKELCQRQAKLIEDFQVSLSWKNLTSEEKEEQSLKILSFSHQMVKELSRYNFRNNDELLKGEKVDPEFVLQLTKLQKPCHKNPQALDRLIKTISENIDQSPRASNWMVYRMAEVSMTFVKSLDSFEAYQMGIHMLDILGKKGHLKKEDMIKVSQLKIRLKKLAKDFNQEILSSSKDNQNVEAIIGHWENQKMITKIEIKRYLSDISRRYPSQERRFGTFTLPEII